MKVPIVLRLLTRDRRYRNALAGIGVVLGAALTAALLLTGSVERAIIDGTRAEYAGYATLVQPFNADGARAIERSPDLVPLWVEPATVTAGSRSAPVGMRFSTGRLPLVPISGRMPTSPGEIALTPRVMAELGLVVSAPLDLESAAGTSRRTVVGVVVDPRDRLARTGVASGALPGVEPTAWLSDQSVFDDQGLADALRSGDVRGRTVGLLASDQVQAGVGPTMTAVRSAWPAAALVIVLLSGFLVGSVVDGVARHEEALQAAGMTRRSARRVITSAAVLALLVAALVGSLLTAALLALARSPISAIADQYWVGLGVRWVPLLLGLAAVPLVVVAVASALRGIRRIRLRRFSAPWPVWVGLAVVGAGVLYLPQLLQDQRRLAWAGGVLLGVGVTGAVSSLLASTRPPTRRRVLRHLVAPLLAPALMVFLITFGLSTAVAVSTKGLTYATSASDALQPAGSILVDGVGERVAEQIGVAFRAAGGTDLLEYELAGERSRPVRITSAHVAQCFAEGQAADPGDVLEACGPSRSRVPINVLGFSPSVTDDQAVVAEPGLVDDGKVGLLFPPRSEGGRWGSQVLAGHALPRAGLGGNLPAGLFSPHSRLARDLGVEHGGGFGVVLLGMDHLASTKQAEVRFSVSQLAGSAGISEFQSKEQSGEAALIALLAWSGVALTGAALWATGQAAVAFSTGTFAALAAAGARRGLRRAALARMFGVLVAAVVAGCAVGRLVAGQLVPAQIGTAGHLWLLPAALVLPLLALQWLLATRDGAAPRS